MLEFAGALSALKGTMELAKVAVEARDDAKAKAAIADMSARLMDAFAVGFAVAEKAQLLQARVAELEKELDEFKSRVAERENYVLHEVGRGNFVYRFEPLHEQPEGRAVPRHYLCQPCFDAGVKSVFREYGSNSLGERTLSCPADARHRLNF